MVGKLFEVDVEDYIIVKYPDKAITVGVESCIGIGILNSKKQMGYLGHYVDLDSSVNNLVDLAIGDAKDIGDLEVVLAGLILFNEETPDCDLDNLEILKNQKYKRKGVLDMLYSKGIKNIKQYLNGNPEDTYQIFIDTEKKSLKATKE